MKDKIINNKKDIRVVVAMSGGVDSSVAAYLLKKEGYDVVGIFLKLWTPPCYNECGIKKQNLCCDDKAMSIARQIADKLEIPFYVLKVDKLFKDKIVDNFVSEYEQGRTPNPCVRCNKYIKFGYLWEKARQLKADYLATGHYIRVAEISNNKKQIPNKSQIRNSKKNQEKNFGNCDLEFVCDLELGACDFHLMRSKDVIKDQTYFLSSIDPSIIPHLLFPLGNMTKKEVREIAKRAKLPVYNKKDSMGVCFIPDGDTDYFLKQYSKKLQKSGEIVDKHGNLLGRHDGLIGYTVGQKVGDDEVAAEYIRNKELRIMNQDRGKHLVRSILEIPRLYITEIDPNKNRLIVGENEDCFSDTVTIENFNVVNDEFWDYIKNSQKPKAKSYLYAQIRGGHKAERCTASLTLSDYPSEVPLPVGEGSKQSATRVRVFGEGFRVKIKFTKKVRAITPGQTIALYEKDVLIGGGIIE